MKDTRAALAKLAVMTTTALAAGLVACPAFAASATPPAGARAVPPVAKVAEPTVFDLLEQEKQNYDIYKAYFPSLEVARKAAISYHAQLLESNYKDGYLVLELDAAEMARMRPFGFRFERATDFIARRNQALTRSQQLQSQRSDSGPQPQAIPATPAMRRWKKPSRPATR